MATRPSKKAWRTWLKAFQWRSSRRVRIAIYALLTIFLFAVLVGTVLPVHYNLAIGQVSQTSIRAPIDAVDTHATDLARQAASALVPPRYDINPATEEQALATLDRLFNTTQVLNSESKLTKTARYLQLRKVAPRKLSSSALLQLLALRQGEFVAVSSDAIRIVQQILQNDFSSSDLKRANMIVDQQLVTLDIIEQSRLLIGQISLSVLQPNLIYNPVLTQQAKLAAQRNVPDVWINRGDMVVRRGQLITPAIMNQLKDLKLLKTEPDYGIYFGFMVFIAILVAATAAFIQIRKGKIAIDNVHLLLYATIMGLMAAMISLDKAGITIGLPVNSSYVIPLAAGSMMTVMFFGTSLAMLTSVFLAVVMSAAFGYDFSHFFVMLSGMIGATLTMVRVKHRRVFMHAGLLAALLNVITLTIMHFLLTSTGSGIRELADQIVFGVISGILSSVLTIGLLPFLETVFRITTHMGLLELGNPNHPLLRKLLIEAPGTYHHSLIVGNLAESAAEEVGADALLCRVGAYYHDVGKMKRPQFYIENQFAGENPHEKIAPNLSCMIVTAHVTDGIEMLRDYKIPEPIRDICAEHHGTTALWYFYNKALEMDKHHVPNIDQYRYPGPRPRSKEAAIVMVCDAVEAAVRSLNKPNPARIENMIRKLIKDRLQDGQFDECELTLADLERMVGAFMRTLQGVYHERIEYPKITNVVELKAKS